MNARNLMISISIYTKVWLPRPRKIDSTGEREKKPEGKKYKSEKNVHVQSNVEQAEP